MRESGFDPSDRFGRFNAGIIDFNPVCLNTLLYLMEHETAEILDILGEYKAGRVWRERADLRREQINALLWDKETGLYLDYNYLEGTRRNYPFATTFYPLFAGIASEEQARRVVANLRLLEAPGGLQTSANRSGSQWDAPFGWAPLQMIAVQGLRRYGYQQEASRISINFLSLVLHEFIRYKAIFEKYDVVQRNIGRAPAYGYTYNVVGFGWTNGVVLELLAELPPLPLSGVGVGRDADDSSSSAS
jgi:alpha,alpha-trehalase